MIRGRDKPCKDICLSFGSLCFYSSRHSSYADRLPLFCAGRISAVVSSGRYIPRRECLRNTGNSFSFFFFCGTKKRDRYLRSLFFPLGALKENYMVLFFLLFPVYSISLFFMSFYVIFEKTGPRQICQSNLSPLLRLLLPLPSWSFL